MIHTGEKLIECDVYIWEQICGVKQSEAKRHIQERSFMNVLYVGRDSWGLKQQMLIHTPHEFDVFGKDKFAVSSNLKQRMMTHTGEKLHECALCGQRFKGVKTTC